MNPIDILSIRLNIGVKDREWINAGATQQKLHTYAYKRVDVTSQSQIISFFRYEMVAYGSVDPCHGRWP